MRLLFQFLLKKLQKSDILDEVVKYLPEHPYLFDPEIITKEHLRDIYKEFIRESIFENISDEILMKQMLL